MTETQMHYIDDLRTERTRLREAAMWVVKNFEEWSDGPVWGGPPFEALAGSIDRLREALEVDPMMQQADADHEKALDEFQSGTLAEPEVQDAISSGN